MTNAERRQRFDKLSKYGCCICRKPAEIHHLIGFKWRGMGQKADDINTIPLCVDHHRGNVGIHHLGMKKWEDVFGEQEYHLNQINKFVNETSNT